MPVPKTAWCVSALRCSTIDVVCLFTVSGEGKFILVKGGNVEIMRCAGRPALGRVVSRSRIGGAAGSPGCAPLPDWRRDGVTLPVRPGRGRRRLGWGAAHRTVELQYSVLEAGV